MLPNKETKKKCHKNGRKIPLCWFNWLASSSDQGLKSSAKNTQFVKSMPRKKRGAGITWFFALAAGGKHLRHDMIHEVKRMLN